MKARFERNMPQCKDEEFPPEFDADIYRRKNIDLANFSEQDLIYHYNNYGKNEGRISSSVISRQSFVELIPKIDHVLEIGPFLKPTIQRSAYNVKYFDVLDRDGIIKKAQNIIDSGSPDAEDFSKRLNDTPKIDFVNEVGDLSYIDCKFNSIFSSHNIEHQVDLIEHLKQVYNILEQNGLYFLIVPDKRYCFDHYRPLTLPSDIIATYLEKPRFHTISRVLEYYLDLTHNNCARHWAGDHGLMCRMNNQFMGNREWVEAVMHLTKICTTQYIDIHNWKFTPDSFRENIEFLFKTGFIKFKVLRIYQTLRNTFEFFVILEKV